MNNTSANLTCKNIFNIILSDIQTLSSYRIVILQNKKKTILKLIFFYFRLVNDSIITKFMTCNSTEPGKIISNCKIIVD